MAQLQKKFIASDAIDGSKIRLDNDQFLKSRNQADSGDVNIVKIDTSNNIKLAAKMFDFTNAAPTDDLHLSNKKYVDDQISAATGAISDWQDSVLDKDITAQPGVPSTGDRYLLGLDTAASIVTGAEWATHDGELAEYNGATWDFTFPTNGFVITADDEATGLYIFSGTTWTLKSYESTTASTGLTKVGFDVRIDSSAAGAGLGFSSGVLSTNVDDTGIEVATDTLQLKDLGVTTAKINALAVTTGKIATDAVDKTKIAADIAGLGLGQAAGGELDVNVDGVGIEISTDTLQLKDLGVTTAKINTDAVTAVKLNADTAGEGLEQEAGGALKAANRVENITLDGTDITNQFVDLAGVIADQSVRMAVKGAPEQESGVDYGVNVTGGAGGVTRLTFLADLATAGAAALVAGDVVIVTYLEKL